MARPGQRIEGRGSSIEFVETTMESDGKRVVVEISYHGDGGRPPEHLHPSQTERFEVLEGTIQARIGGAERTLEAGDTVTVPPGTAHEMWVTEPARQRWETSPALRTERFFETVWGLQQDGQTDAKGMPGKLQMALTLRHFSDELRLTAPPGAVQAVLFPALAALARVRGLEPEYTPRA